MDDLVAFLNARLDEDEAAAKAATPGPWEWVTPEHAEWDDYGPHLKSKTATWMSPEGRGPYPAYVLSSWGHDAWGVNIEDAAAAHIARHDPVRALREVAAKRQLIAVMVPWLNADEDDSWANRGVGIQPPYEGSALLLKVLATVYSVHPDYRAEGKP